MTYSIEFLARSRILSVLLVAGAMFAKDSAIAEEELIGSGEFRISCASCHGVGGEGVMETWRSF